MIMHPAIIALTVGSLIVSFMILYAAFYGVKILSHWDLKSGSELQLDLERRTYLISTMMGYAFCFQLFSLFLFIFTADDLSRLFVGAMCAAGTLNVNGFGYPTLALKIICFLLGGVWLIINYTDNQAIDYPLIRRKYLFLLLIVPFIVTETVLQGCYFFTLDAHVITSCCGTLFNAESKSAGAVFTFTPGIALKTSFYVILSLTGISGIWFYFRGKATAGYAFAALSLLWFVIGIISLISFISLYIYQLPTHHCPFCILQKEYSYIGYLLYVGLLGSTVTGVAVGVIMPARHLASLRELVPSIQKRLTLTSLLFLLLFAVIAFSKMIFTDFRLVGY